MAQVYFRRDFARETKLRLTGVAAATSADLASNFPKVGNSDQAVLAGEREGLIAALGLCHAENSMIACVVNGDHALIIDHQAAAVREDSVSKIVLCADSAGPAQSGRPPVR
jgi:hypothetical protein